MFQHKSVVVIMLGLLCSMPLKAQSSTRSSKNALLLKAGATAVGVGVLAFVARHLYLQHRECDAAAYTLVALPKDPDNLHIAIKIQGDEYSFHSFGTRVSRRKLHEKVRDFFSPRVLNPVATDVEGWRVHRNPDVLKPRIIEGGKRLMIGTGQHREYQVRFDPQMFAELANNPVELGLTCLFMRPQLDEDTLYAACNTEGVKKALFVMAVTHELREQSHEPVCYLHVLDAISTEVYNNLNQYRLSAPGWQNAITQQVEHFKAQAKQLSQYQNNKQ